ncbi:hypothetical protein LOTGIDRAFT_133798 [Lottia gigantea]|uniref:CRAL-TRIO domain-containing protein n=1 Tax=Lottia gigantea TaxID=225164 RepID=V3ZLD3_LOTGI|nr:hypothetical protein LOTGIDRAFT_133798 [Lottia gigantea]ESO83200.1 hypothetical protein LOTGIDRAFT_133798 [Lottia gigantea]
MAEEQYGKFTSSLSEASLEKAATELNENPSTRDLEIKTLRERVKSYPGLKARLDSAFLLRFLRAKKFDQERAFKTLLSFYQMRVDSTDLFKDMVPSSVKSILDNQAVGVLDHPDKEGRKVIIVRPGKCKWNPNEAPVNDMFKTLYLTLSKVIEDEEIQIHGLAVIVELGEISWTHAKAISPLYAKRMSGLLQEAFPARIKSIHYVNEPVFFDVIFAIIKQFLKEKILKRLHFHGKNVTELHEYIDPQYLPEEFQGQGPKFSTTVCMEFKLFDYSEP